MNIGVYIKDTYTNKGRSSTLEWANDLSAHGHDVYLMFPRDVEQMHWREYDQISRPFSEFFKKPNKKLAQYNHDKKQLKKIRSEFKRRGEDTSVVNTVLKDKRDEWKQYRAWWADMHFPRTRREPEMDMLLFRKAGRNFKEQYAPDITRLAQAYPQAGQINDARLVANMDKTFMSRLDDEYTLDTRFPDSLDGILDAIKHYQQAVIKPVDGRAGYGVSRVNYTDDGLEFIQQEDNAVSSQYLRPSQLEGKLASLRDQEGRLVVQRYAPEITDRGETRLMIVGGDIVGAVTTKPNGNGSFLSNVAKGASSYVLDELPADTQGTAEYLTQFMKDNNISVARGDIIYNGGPKVNEINLVSPGTKSFTQDRAQLRRSLVDVVENYQGSASIQRAS